MVPRPITIRQSALGPSAIASSMLAHKSKSTGTAPNLMSVELELPRLSTASRQIPSPLHGILTQCRDSPDWCSGRHVGYAPAHIIVAADRTQLSDIEAGTSDSLTRAMILHPIACGTAFIAWIVSIGAGVIGSLFGVLAALVAWILCLIVMATDFSLFGILRHHVNHDRSGSRAYFGSAMWCLCVAFVLLFFAMIIVTFTCFSARREKKKAVAVQKEARPATRKKRFGIL
jgi:amino acid transporter